MPLKVLAFVLGIGLFQQLSSLPDVSTITIIFLLTVFWGYQREWLLCIFFSGWLWAGLFAVWHLTTAHLPDSLEGQDLLVQGTIDSLPQRDER
jgi:competence protein ComEC